MRKQKILFAIFFIIILVVNFSYCQNNGKKSIDGSNQSMDLNNNFSWIINWDNVSWRVGAVVTDTLENAYCMGVIDLSPLGYIAPPNIVSIFILKINSSGFIIWTKKFNYTYFYIDLEIDSDNNIYSLWYINFEKYLLLKLDSSGNLLWNYTVEGYFYEIYIDNYKNIHLLGYEYQQEGLLRLLKLNESGNMEYNFSISFDFEPQCFRVDDLNNSYIASYSYEDHLMGLYKVNSSGGLNLVKELDQSPDYRHLLFDYHGNLYVFGEYNSFSNVLFKYNVSGDRIFISNWKSYIPMVHLSRWHEIAVDSLGNIFCAGLSEFYTLTAFSEIFLVKYSQNGTLLGDYLWTKYRDMVSLSDVHTDHQNNLYFVGSSEKGSFIVKNPSLVDYLIKIFDFYLDEETLSTLVTVSIFFGVWSLLGISLYIYYFKKGKR